MQELITQVGVLKYMTRETDYHFNAKTRLYGKFYLMPVIVLANNDLSTDNYFFIALRKTLHTVTSGFGLMRFSTPALPG